MNTKNIWIGLLTVGLLISSCKHKEESIPNAKPGETMFIQDTLVENTKSIVQHFNFDQMKSDTIGAGITRKWFHGEKGQMTIFNLEKGAHIPRHQHPNEQITYIMEGKVKIKTIIDDKEQFIIVSAGEVIVFPENVPHEFWALENTVDLDVHVPVRQDWLSDELPDYLKKTQ